MIRLQRAIMLREPASEQSATTLVTDQPSLPGRTPDSPSILLRLFDVHIFAVVRVKVENVSAHTYAQAIHEAHLRVNLDERFNGDWTEEVTEYLVDVAGDEDYSHSRYFDDDPTGTRQYLNRVVSLHQDGLSPAELASALQQLACEVATHLRNLGEPPPAVPHE